MSFFSHPARKSSVSLSSLLGLGKRLEGVDLKVKPSRIKRDLVYPLSGHFVVSLQAVSLQGVTVLPLAQHFVSVFFSLCGKICHINVFSDKSPDLF